MWARPSSATASCRFPFSKNLRSRVRTCNLTYSKTVSTSACSLLWRRVFGPKTKRKPCRSRASSKMRWRAIGAIVISTQRASSNGTAGLSNWLWLKSPRSQDVSTTQVIVRRSSPTSAPSSPERIPRSRSLYIKVQTFLSLSDPSLHSSEWCSPASRTSQAWRSRARKPSAAL